MKFSLEFEKPIAELEQKISELKALSRETDVDMQSEIKKLESKLDTLVNKVFSSLSPWQRTQLSRHANRPYTFDYIEEIFTDFVELHGDRNFSDDPSIMGGIGRFQGQAVMILGHQKGRNTKEKIRHNFGMPKPEGYRKALRLMSMAERFKLPLITFIDTPGAYPGIEAEERGQSEAIAKNIMVMTALKIPIISVVIGEGGSGGALAIGVSNKILMLENSVYSVISPESCAAILWRDSGKADLAATSLKLTAIDIHKLGIADEIIAEPDGGAHRNFKATAKKLSYALREHLAALKKLGTTELIAQRHHKFRNIGVYEGSHNT